MIVIEKIGFVIRSDGIKDVLWSSINLGECLRLKKVMDMISNSMINILK